MSMKNRIMAVTPMVCVIIFLTLGFVWDLWHPGWIVFLLIPVMPYLIGKKKLKFTIPLVITIAYLIMGIGWDLWHPGWIIFLLIPVITILTGGKEKKLFDNIKKSNKDDYIDVD